MLRSGCTSTRPARSTGAPSFLPSGEAATPAAHKITAAFIRCFAHGNDARLYLRNHGRGKHFHAQPLQLFQRAARKIFGIRRKHMRAAFDEMDASAPRIDRAKILGESMTANFG